MGADLHHGFAEPGAAPALELTRFLEAVDRLVGIRAIRRAMRRAIDLRAGMHLLDAGCGTGLEAARLAAEHPTAQVTGLDRNADLLRTARRDAPPGTTWLEADLTASDLPDATFDVVRTERVLMYLPGDELGRGLDELIRLLRPGGRLVLFELDYGGNILPPGRFGDDVVQRAAAVLDDSLPQPRAGRRIPGLLRERGMLDVAASPYSFALDEPVWRRIIHDTLKAGDPDTAVSAWLDETAASAAAEGAFLAACTGVLTTARRP